MSSDKLYFFIGIGGIGMSALAEYMKCSGCIVYGTDKNLQNNITDELKKKDIYIFPEEDSIDLLSYFYFNKLQSLILVRTNTVLDSHPIIEWALSKEIEVKYRANVLGEILENKEVIGITGSHGKTSTTGLISSLFIDAKKDPTVFVGGIMEKIKNNVKVGSSNIAVVEADDAYKSFLTLNPKIAVVTTVSYEHLETYKDWDDIYNTFAEYTNKADIKILNYDSVTMKKLADEYINNPITYGALGSNAIYTYQNVKMEHNMTSYDLYFKDSFISSIKLPIISVPLIVNSMATAIVGLEYGISLEIIRDSLWNYKGVQRRLQTVGLYKKKTTIIDDYGHHPVELGIVFETLLKTFNGRLIVFFQPHKYTRTFHLWDEFIRVLTKYPIYRLYVTDVFDAGDQKMDGYTSQDLVHSINKSYVKYINIDMIQDEIVYELSKIEDLNSNDCILTLGAGKLDQVAKYLTTIL